MLYEAGFFPNRNRELTPLQETAVILMNQLLRKWKLDNKAQLTV